MVAASVAQAARPLFFCLFLSHVCYAELLLPKYGAERLAHGRHLAATDLPLDTIRLPPGFSIDLYSPDSFPARFLALGQSDANATVVYVSSTQDVVTALVDRRDGSPVRACTLLSSQDNPNGVAYDAATRSLYVAEVRAITRYDNVDAAALAGCDPGLLQATEVAGADLLPPQASHANRALAIGPEDGKLYVTVAAPFNVAECVDPYCTIHRLDRNGSGWEVFARGGPGPLQPALLPCSAPCCCAVLLMAHPAPVHPLGITAPLPAGIRNAAGFDWNAETGALLWSGMERDRMGDDLPDDVLGASFPDQPGVDWGFPYCHW